MISLQNVTFGYKKFPHVLQDFSLQFRDGGVYGLLGKNGTGKSTMLYLMAGLLRPQSGEVWIDACHPSDRQSETMRDIFIVPEEYDLPHIMLSDYVNAIKPFYPRFSDELLERCLSCFDMPHDVYLGALSMGQKKKVYICLALATNTRYLLMDEPTNGLDILSKSQFRKALVNGMSDDKTIVISTHQVHDVENILDHVTIIDCGNVLYSSPLDVEQPTNLEQLFIDVQHGRIPDVLEDTPRRLGDEQSQQESEEITQKTPWYAFPRWDVTFNRQFYLRMGGGMLMAFLLLVAVNVMLVVFDAVGLTQRLTNSTDVIASYMTALLPFFLWVSMGYTFHNMLTRKSRLAELMVPSSTMCKFLWHTSFCILAPLAIFVMAVLAGDLINAIALGAMYGDAQSLTLAVLKNEFLSSLEIVEADATIAEVFFATAILSAIHYSFVVTVGSIHYRHNLFYTVLYYVTIALGFAIVVGFTGTYILPLCGENFFKFLESMGGFFEYLITAFFLLFLAAEWWLAFRNYKRAQLSTPRNP